MSIFGNSALDQVINHGMTALGQSALDNPSMSLYLLLETYPWSKVVIPTTVFISFVFFVTSADPGTVVLSTLSATGGDADEDGPNWLNDPARYTYDLNAPEGTGYEVLVNFLFNDRRGYCIHFASSMALMAKAVGIPPRVAVGFTAGTQQADGTGAFTTNAVEQRKIILARDVQRLGNTLALVAIGQQPSKKRAGTALVKRRGLQR